MFPLSSLPLSLSFPLSLSVSLQLYCLSWQIDPSIDRKKGYTEGLSY
jgi:hypothetical protein